MYRPLVLLLLQTACSFCSTFQWFGANNEPIEAALRAGYRLIDCAALYRNEPEIGEALQKCFKEGVVKRENVFITSKLW